jgi:hypothetical protein
VGEAQDTADNTDEDSRESDDEEAVVQVTLHQSPYGASIVDSAPDQQDCGPFHNHGDPGDVGENRPAFRLRFSTHRVRWRR